MKAEQITDRMLKNLTEQEAALDRYFEVLHLERTAILAEDTEKLGWYMEREREIQKRLERLTSVEQADARALGNRIPELVGERRAMIRERYNLLSEYCDENIQAMNERLSLLRDRITSVRSRRRRPVPVYSMQVEAGFIDDKA